ncbi:hypothetical protein N665_1430s0008 [Sinapis alba]|nr:hypothetical protein N665_1430s0008 [Sinapis alba]
MEKNLVGYRFSPTNEELINYYLKYKILYPWLVDDVFSEIDICAHDPEFLPSLSKLKSDDLEWYFFTPREYYGPEKLKKKKGMNRKTPSGFWKITGQDVEIKDKRGHGIGIKKPLVYRQGKGNGVWTPWVMHEYQITSLPPNQSNYVICKVIYKGVDGDSLFGNNSNQLNHYNMVSDLNTVREINTAPQVEQPWEENLFMPTPMNEQDDFTQFISPQIPWDEEYLRESLPFNGDINIIFDQHRNNHRPKKPLTGFLSDCSSESNDAESIFATSYQGISSPDSAHNMSRHFHKGVLSSSSGEEEIPSLRKGSCKDTQPPARRTKQEVNEGKFKAVDASKDKKSSSPMMKTEKKKSSSPMVKTEKKKGRRNRKNPRYIYLMNMIISFILLVAVIGNITSVSLSFKT